MQGKPQNFLVGLAGVLDEILKTPFLNTNFSKIVTGIKLCKVSGCSVVNINRLIVRNVNLSSFCGG